MDRPNNDKELHTEEEVASSEVNDDAHLVEKEKEIVVETLEVPIYEVKDLGVEFVEGKEEVGRSNLGEDECVGEIVEEKKLSGEESMYPVSEQLLEAGEEAQDSVPTSSLVCESDDVEEAGEGVPNIGTMIEMTTVDMTEDGDASSTLLERCASLWNCCGLLDVFKSCQG